MGVRKMYKCYKLEKIVYVLLVITTILSFIPVGLDSTGYRCFADDGFFPFIHANVIIGDGSGSLGNADPTDFEYYLYGIVQFCPLLYVIALVFFKKYQKSHKLIFIVLDLLLYLSIFFGLRFFVIHYLPIARIILPDIEIKWSVIGLINNDIGFMLNLIDIFLLLILFILSFILMVLSHFKTKKY